MKFVTQKIMDRLRNSTCLKPIRKMLRNDQTEHERILWSRLRNKQLNRLKFYRQYSIGNYVVDFYCPKKRLGIELDGGQHNEAKSIQYDHGRTDFIAQQGITLLRFWNNEIKTNLEGVLESIATKAEA